MAAYLFVEISEIRDEEMYLLYIQRAGPIIEKYGGEYILRSNKISAISGSTNLVRALLIKFESLDLLRECFSSKEYNEIKHLRENSVESEDIVIE